MHKILNILHIDLLQDYILLFYGLYPTLLLYIYYYKGNV